MVLAARTCRRREALEPKLALAPLLDDSSDSSAFACTDLKGAVWPRHALVSDRALRRRRATDEILVLDRERLARLDAHGLGHAHPSVRQRDPRII